MTPEVTAALVGLIGIIITAATTIITKMRRTARQYERELRFRTDVLTLKINFYDWNDIQQELDNLMETSSIGRFLILNAFNGKDDPKWTTAIYQMHSDGNKGFVSYVNVELDPDYITRLRETKKTNTGVQIDTDTIPPSLIKSIYKAEGIKHAIWFPLQEKKLEDSKTVGISYCSFASYNDDHITDETYIHCKRITDMMRAAIYRAEHEAD